MASVKSKVPKLRFKGFSGEWNITKLCDISDKVQEKNKNNLINETFTNSAEYGIINQRDFFNKDISNEINLCHYYVVQPNDFVYNPRISNLAPVGPIKRNKLNRTGVMSPLYYVFRTHSINNDFLDYYFSTSKWHRFMFMNGDKGARSDRFAIGDSVFRTMPILTPKQQEQTQIGHFFQKLDQVIELQQNTITQAQNYKKAMLQKMFPQKGEKVPRIRFKGFSENWDEKKLGEIVEIIMGQSPDGANYTNNPNDYILVQGNADLKNGFVVPRVYTTQITKKIARDNIILTVRAPVGAVAITNFDVVLGRGVAGIKGNLFIYYLLLLIELSGIWTQLSSGSTFDSINSNHIKQILIKIPNLKEQTQIGNFFQQLDKQITEQQNKLTHYQTLKKAMLQRLFI